MKKHNYFYDLKAKGDRIRKGSRKRTLPLDDRIFAFMVPSTPEVVCEHLAKMPSLISGLPRGIVNSIERIRKVLRLAPFDWELFTVANDLTYPVYEMALRYKLFQEIKKRTGEDTITLKKKGEKNVKVNSIHGLFERMGDWWQLVDFPEVKRSLNSFFTWAKRKRFLDEKWTKGRIGGITTCRNNQAHGVSYKLEGVEFRGLKELIEFVNELFEEKEI